MTVIRGEVVDGAAQVEVADNGAGAQVEVLAHQARDLLIGDGAGAKGLHVDGERVRHADGVRHLDLDAVRQAGCHHVLGDPAAGIRCRAVDLGGILTAEGAAAVPPHAAVGIHDDLASGHARITHGSADDEAPGGVDVDLRTAVHEFSRDDGVDDVLDDRLADLGMADLGGVLGGDEHVVHAHRLAVGVLHGHLALAIRAQPGQGAVLAHFRQPPGKLVRQVDGHRHQGGGLIAGEPEHHPLVASADFVDLLVGQLAAFDLVALVHTASDILALAGNGAHHRAGVAVKALLAAVVADALDHPADEFVEVHESVGGDLAQHHHEAGLGGGFASHTAAGVLLQAGIQHRIAHLVAQFVGVSLRHALGGEFIACAIHKSIAH